MLIHFYNKPIRLTTNNSNELQQGDELNNESYKLYNNNKEDCLAVIVGGLCTWKTTL